MMRLLFRLFFGARKPTVSGELAIPGLEQSVVIRRDAYGIPHIDAATDADAAFALGFVQAQDRAGQLEVYLRIVRGTLSELVGSAALPVDRLSRRVGFRRAGLQQLSNIDDDVRLFLEAYGRGINAGHEFGAKQWPHEFSLLKSTPTPWDAADVLAYVKFMSFQLPSNWDVEIARFLMLKHNGPEVVAALDPSGLVAPVDGDPGQGLTKLLFELQALGEFAPRGGGSNNWLVDGSRSATGKPLLAGDPHLGPTLPNPWYLAHITTPSWNVAGACFAGSPVFPIAHNGFACWSVTAGLTDNTDLFLETLDGHKVMQPDGCWVDCEVLRETIKVKDGASVEEEVLITPRGPIVTPLIPDEPHALSLQAVWLKPRKFRGFYDSVRKRSFEEFRQCFRAWPVLPLNVLYADETGEVGYQLTGDLPIRSGSAGMMPTPVSRGDWSGYVPFEAMPMQRNPADRLFATANDPPPPGEGEPFLGTDFVDPYRAEIIREELAKRHDWTVSDFQQLQLNQRSKPWEEIRDVVLALTTDKADAVTALAELRAWDGQVSAESSAAAIFELFIAEMCVRVAKSKAKSYWKLAVGGDGHGAFSSSLLADRRVKHLVRLILTQSAGWFESWNAEMIDALEAVIRKLRDEAGPSTPYWAWGHRRMLRLRHPILGKHWLFSRVFNLGPVPIGGDMNTVAQAGVRPLTPFAETHNFPNLRSVFDTSNWSNCRFALAGGQSGNPCSEHFNDQFPLWQRGEGVPMPWTNEEVIKATKSALKLHPAG